MMELTQQFNPPLWLILQTLGGPTAGENREFVRKKLADLPTLSRDNVARTKRELIEQCQRDCAYAD
jgi:hypothetical protein